MPVDDPLTLPTVPAPPARSPFPVVATLVPLVGGVALWAVLGSPFALLFALLGPLVAVGGVLDQVRGNRTRRRRTESEFALALSALHEEVDDRHTRERRLLCARHPDVAAFAARREDIWRPLAERGDELTVGRGVRPSAVRFTGAAAHPEADRLRGHATELKDAPIGVDWRAGIVVRGEPALARAVLRGLILQLCLAHAPDVLRIAGAVPPGWAWLQDLPHRRQGTSADKTLVVVADGIDRTTAPGAVFMTGAMGSAVDPRCGAILDVIEPARAILTKGLVSSEVAVEAVSLAQAEVLGRVLGERGHALYGDGEGPDPVSFADLRAEPGVGAAGALAVALGREGDSPAIVDLVADGPHAVVTGITGSGKSELLTTWVTALCAAYSTRDVALLLADFKGGMTFEALASLPHVTGVITDLDGHAADRAIASLRAELRRREHELALCGARDIADPGVELPRLVIVVDEFAALLAEHDGLHRVFGDVAARGRALGMHLVLGSQRVPATVSDALLSNCPLRIALRAADAADSRAVLGSDAAAFVPGGMRGRGRAFVRRAGDVAPQPMRVALTTRADIAEAADSAAGQSRPRRAWMPVLPSEIRIHDLRRRQDAGHGILLGLADDPAQQRQFVARLDEHAGLTVVGRAKSGKSALIAFVAEQAPGAVLVPGDLEAAWDTLMASSDAGGHMPDDGGAGAGPWLIDDADDLLARLPPDHSSAVADRLDRLARAGRLVMTARGLSGRLARIADAMPRRALLALSSRTDHVVAGGEAAGFRRDAPPGRGVLDGSEVQFGRGEPRTGPPPADPPPWTPSVLAGIVTRRVAHTVQQLRGGDGAGAGTPGMTVRAVGDLALGVRISDVSADRSPGETLILVGDGEDWLARWGLLQELRARHPLVVDADCPAELRTVAGERALAPYARPGAGRGWLCAAGAEPVRVGMTRVASAGARRPG